MVYKGFKFGLLLQIAIGPMCILVFNTAATHGFMKGMALVLAISLMDALYIFLSGLGIAQLLRKERVRTTVQRLGCLVLVLFGANMAMSALGFSLLPKFALFSKVTNQNLFMQGLLLTASNPLTVLFWGGVFSAQVAAHDYQTHQLVLFAVGCVLSSLVFLTLIALGGSVLTNFLSPRMIQVLNGAVGLILIYFGLKLLKK